MHIIRRWREIMMTSRKLQECGYCCNNESTSYNHIHMARGNHWYFVFMIVVLRYSNVDMFMLHWQIHQISCEHLSGKHPSLDVPSRNEQMKFCESEEVATDSFHWRTAAITWNRQIDQLIVVSSVNCAIFRLLNINWWLTW